jgi:hypothetical protein
VYDPDTAPTTATRMMKMLRMIVNTFKRAHRTLRYSTLGKPTLTA